jgi:hypothetical protein
MNDLLASGILLGGSSVALALTALAARRASRCAQRSEFAAANARADRKEANHRAKESGDWCEASKRHAQHAMRAVNAIELDRLFNGPSMEPPTGITVTPPETVDVIPIPVPPLKLYAEVEGVPGSVVDADDAADVIEFAHYWQDNGGEGGGVA